MSIDSEAARTGYTKLYHPRGALVSLPVVGETPSAMFAWVTSLMDAGFVVSAPGLEVGEEREMASAVLHSTFEREGEITPTILLYAANEGLEYSFLKLYLNNDEDVKCFEAACGVKLDSLTVYDGKDKPKRDGSTVAKKYIIKLPKPVAVVFKVNPKWDAEESAKALAAGKPYTVPKRIFVRWADLAAPEAVPQQTQPATQPPVTAHTSDMDVAVAAWKARLANVIGKDDLNKLIPMVKAITDESIRKKAWTMCLDFADTKKWVFSKEKTIFIDSAEVTPPVASTPVSPPPDDEPAVAPLVATWQKKIAGVDLNTFTTATLNDSMLPEFKKIPRSEGKVRDEIWVMLSEFANKYGCKFDTQTMKFIDTMP